MVSQMACYTALSHQQIAHFLTAYDLGKLVSYQGISGGIENTNYFVTIKKDNLPEEEYVLTLFEDLDYDELPYFISLTEHLVGHDLCVPAPLRDKSGNGLQKLAGKPALLLPKFSGKHLSREEIDANICTVIGTQLASMHQVGQTFDHYRQPHRGAVWWSELGPKVMSQLDTKDADMLMQAINAYQQFIDKKVELPLGVVHGDLFHDNVLFCGTTFSAIIDLYNACTDFLLFDVAVAVNDWCISSDGRIKEELLQAFIRAYDKVRPFTHMERKYWNFMLQTAAMRFWLSRLEAYHDAGLGKDIAGQTEQKDPDVYRSILLMRNENLSSI